MRARTIAKLTLILSVCALGAGLFAKEAQGRGRPPGTPPTQAPATNPDRIVSPPPLPNGKPGGIEEQGKYQMGVPRTHYGGSPGPGSNAPGFIGAQGVRSVSGGGSEVAAPLSNPVAGGNDTRPQSLGTGASQAGPTPSIDAAKADLAGLTASQKCVESASKGNFSSSDSGATRSGVRPWESSRPSSERGAWRSDTQRH